MTSPAGSLRRHWPEYAMEGALLGLFMVSACVFGTLLESPSVPVRDAVPDAGVRRGLMGIAMGLTAVALIYSPWGARSGAHMNPAVTATFLRLGKVARTDAVFYGLFQVLGGLAGVWISAWLLGPALREAPVRYVVTVPGMWGQAAAFAAETGITFGLMAVILWASNHASWSRWTGILAGVLIAVYITIEAPVSGTSMNPARTLASALPAGSWEGLWLYFVAPPLGMLLAAEAYVRAPRARSVFCAKLHHAARVRCIFCQHQHPAGS